MMSESVKDLWGMFIFGVIITLIFMIIFVPKPLEVECITRLEYAATAADTLSIVRDYKYCDEYLNR